MPIEHRVAEVVQPPRLLDDRVVLLAARLVDEIVPVVADHRLVRRNDRDLELVDLEELRLFRLGRAGHAGQLVVHAEVVLDRDRRHRLRLALHADAFLGLDRLVQSLRPATARHRAAGELVDDQHLAVLHDVVHVALVQRVRAQQLVHDVQPLGLRRVVDLDLPPRLDLLLGGACRDRDRCGAPPARDPGSTNASCSFGDMKSTPRSVRCTECPFSSSTNSRSSSISRYCCLFAGQPAVGDVLELHLLHELLGALLLQHLHEPLVLRAAELRLVELQRRGGGVALLASRAPPRRRARSRAPSAGARAARPRRCARSTSRRSRCRPAPR